VRLGRRAAAAPTVDVSLVASISLWKPHPVAITSIWSAEFSLPGVLPNTSSKEEGESTVGLGSVGKAFTIRHRSTMPERQIR
jgi:hypothetical protein